MIKIVRILNVLFMLRKWESKWFLGVYLSWIHCHFFIIHWKYTIQCLKRQARILPSSTEWFVLNLEHQLWLVGTNETFQSWKLPESSFEDDESWHCACVSLPLLFLTNLFYIWRIYFIYWIWRIYFVYCFIHFLQYNTVLILPSCFRAYKLFN